MFSPITEIWEKKIMANIANNVYCQYITEGTEHTFNIDSKEFEIRVPFNWGCIKL